MLGRNAGIWGSSTRIPVEAGTLERENLCIVSGFMGGCGFARAFTLQPLTAGTAPKRQSSSFGRHASYTVLPILRFG